MLGDIAKRFDVSIEDLQDANPAITDINRIRVGQEIVIPFYEPEVEAPQVPPALPPRSQVPWPYGGFSAVAENEAGPSQPEEIISFAAQSAHQRQIDDLIEEKFSGLPAWAQKLIKQEIRDFETENHQSLSVDRVEAYGEYVQDKCAVHREEAAKIISHYPLATEADKTMLMQQLESTHVPLEGIREQGLDFAVHKIKTTPLFAQEREALLGGIGGMCVTESNYAEVFGNIGAQIEERATYCRLARLFPRHLKPCFCP